MQTTITPSQIASHSIRALFQLQVRPIRLYLSTPGDAYSTHMYSPPIKDIPRQKACTGALKLYCRVLLVTSQDTTILHPSAFSTGCLADRITEHGWKVSMRWICAVRRIISRQAACNCMSSATVSGYAVTCWRPYPHPGNYTAYGPENFPVADGLYRHRSLAETVYRSESLSGEMEAVPSPSDDPYRLWDAV